MSSEFDSPLSTALLLPIKLHGRLNFIII